LDRRRIPWVALLALLLGAAASGARSETLDERLPLAEGGRVTIDLDLGIGLRPDRGALEVVAHDAADVHLVAESSGFGAWGVVFELDPRPDAIRLTGRVDGATSWMFGGPRVVVRAFVPRGATLDLRTSAGPISVEGTGGDLRVRADDGDVEVQGARGAIKLRTLRGRVEASAIEGELDVKTSEGDIEITDIGGSVRARTTLGTIEAARIRGSLAARAAQGEIELLEVEGPVEARTGRGAVRLHFVSDPTGALETADGGIDVSFPTRGAADLDARASQVEIGAGVAFVGESEDGQAIGALNEGGAPLWLRAPRGRIRLSRR